MDNDGGVTTAADECLINYTRVAGTNTRTVAVDSKNDVWVGGNTNLGHEKLSGVDRPTGRRHPVQRRLRRLRRISIDTHEHAVVGAQRRRPAALRPRTATGRCLDTSTATTASASTRSPARSGTRTSTATACCKLAPDGTVLGAFAHGNQYAQGVAVDASGNVWVAHSLIGATTVGHLRTDGTYVGNVTLPGGNGPTGVAVDSNGKVWVANINTNNAQRIDPAAGPTGGGGPGRRGRPDGQPRCRAPGRTTTAT